MGLERRSIRIGDDTVSYVHRPLPSPGGPGPPMVLIHGIAGAAEWWGKNLETLGRHFELYVPDLPGFGCSSLGRRRFDIDDEAAVLDRWMGALGLGRAVLVGHSMGGYLAAKQALRAPASAAALILVDAAIFPEGYGCARLARGLLPGLFNLSRDFWPTLLRGAFAAGLPTMLRAARGLLVRPILGELPAIGAPSLLVWGDRDSVVPLEVGHRIKEALGSGASGPLLLQGGHVPMWDDAARFDDAVLRFLGGIGLLPAEGSAGDPQR